MPHCTNCGTEIAASAQFCPTCGKAQPPSPGGSPPPVATATGAGLSENAAGALCYVLGWITGIIFFLVDKRPFVRFHAAQSLVTFGGLHLIRIVMAMFFGAGILFGGWGHWGYAGWGGFGLGVALFSLFGILIFVLWIVCMAKAGSGQRFVLPISGPIAENIAKQ